MVSHEKQRPFQNDIGAARGRVIALAMPSRQGAADMALCPPLHYNRQLD
jgi:hypothetical protein